MTKNKKLLCLLIGINNYPDNPLHGCVNDVGRVETYLNNLKAGDSFQDVQIVTLLNEQADKASVVKNIQTHLGQAKDTDVAFFYYSGHGANESAGGLFKDELDDLLECIVCFPKEVENQQYLLADKELRYLFSELPNNPHLVTVFDACHSGDMTRSGEEDLEAPILKRLSKAFPARDYQDFIFSSKIKKSTVEKEDLSDLIPNKNHVHIAACLSNESSWEKKGSGVFTSYLLQLLEATNNELNYLDITRYAKMSLRNMTQTQQTPTINTVGEGTTNHLSSWLNIHSEMTPNDNGMLTHHQQDGWIYTHGKLMGVEDGAQLTCISEDKKLTTKINETFLTYSIIEQTEEMANWDTNNKIRAYTNTLFAPLEIYVNGKNDKIKEFISTIIDSIENVSLVERDQACFFLNIFNSLVYFSKKEDPYRPLAHQFDLLDNKLKLEDFLADQLNYFIKWNHFNTLENPAHPFNFTKDQQVQKPIEVTFFLEGAETNTSQKTTAKNILDDAIEFPAISERHKTKGYYYNRYRVNLKNVSNKELFIGVLRLGSDLSIDCYCNGEVLRLPPDKDIDLYTTKPDKSIRRVSFYDYQEGYNWKNEEIIFKFIINTEDFTPTFKKMEQPALSLPYMPCCVGDVTHRSAGRSATMVIPTPMEWDVYSTSIRLANPSYNKFEGQLAKCPQKMDEDVWFGPFIAKLYNEKALANYSFKALERT